MSLQQRLYFCACLAGTMVEEGMTNEHAAAFNAVLNSKPAELFEMVREVPGWNEMPVLALLKAIIERNAEELNTLSALQQWAARKVAYDANCASWIRARAETDDIWRSKPMSARQRYLLADTAQILEIQFPEGMNRGDAADWLEANGANVQLKIGGEWPWRLTKYILPTATKFR